MNEVYYISKAESELLKKTRYYNRTNLKFGKDEIRSNSPYVSISGITPAKIKAKKQYTKTFFRRSCWIKFSGIDKVYVARIMFNKTFAKSDVKKYTKEAYREYLTTRFFGFYLKDPIRKIISFDLRENFIQLNDFDDFVTNWKYEWGFCPKEAETGYNFNLAKKFKFPLYSEDYFDSLSPQQKEEAEKACELTVNEYWKAGIMFESELQEKWIKDIWAGYFQDPLKEKYNQIAGFALIGKTKLGKSKLGQLFYNLFYPASKNFTDSFCERFNLHNFATAPFGYVDDASNLRGEEVTAVIKMLVTQVGRIYMDVKGKEQIEVESYVHPWFSSNNPALFQADPAIERRIQIIHFTEERIRSQKSTEIYNKIIKYYEGDPNNLEVKYYYYCLVRYFLNYQIMDINHLYDTYRSKEFEEERIEADDSKESTIRKIWLNRAKYDVISLTDKFEHEEVGCNISEIKKSKEIISDACLKDESLKNMNKIYLTEKGVRDFTKSFLRFVNKKDDRKFSTKCPPTRILRTLLEPIVYLAEYKNKHEQWTTGYLYDITNIFKEY